MATRRLILSKTEVRRLQQERITKESKQNKRRNYVKNKL